MPFKETCPMEERIALFREYETGVFTVSDLCRRPPRVSVRGTVVHHGRRRRCPLPQIRRQLMLQLRQPRPAVASVVVA
jgi:hypothetical protein